MNLMILTSGRLFAPGAVPEIILAIPDSPELWSDSQNALSHPGENKAKAHCQPSIVASEWFVSKSEGLPTFKSSAETKCVEKGSSVS
jgi:hypothetical protein